jgi:hypothetical protein
VAFVVVWEGEVVPLDTKFSMALQNFQQPPMIDNQQATYIPSAYIHGNRR